MNKCDLITKQDKERIKRTLRQFNKRAEIIETVKSNIDLKKVINTGKFNFEEAAKHTQWLAEDRYDINPETEEYGVSSFTYEATKPFNPERLKKVLDDNFVLAITNVDHSSGAPVHAHDHGEEEEEGEDDEYDGECEDGETEEEFMARVARAR